MGLPGSKFHSNSCLALKAELVSRVAAEDITFTNPGVTDEDNYKRKQQTFRTIGLGERQTETDRQTDGQRQTYTNLHVCFQYICSMLNKHLSTFPTG